MHKNGLMRNQGHGWTPRHLNLSTLCGANPSAD
jgi:hypothetical protein